MSTHPNSIDLEAFACGESIAEIEQHLGECAACTAFVERVRGALSAGPSRPKASARIAAIAAGSPRDDRPEPPVVATAPRRSAGTVTWLVRASSVAVPLAAAAAILFYLRTPSTNDAILVGPGEASGPASTAISEPRRDPEPTTTFKGAIPIAVIRERSGQQERFTGSVQVRPNDRLRVEVALDREQAILAAVLGDDDSWLEVMPEGVRPAGTHFSERSAKVDASPLRGTILVGSPEAVLRARQTKRFDDVTTVRVEWATR